ncbi:hypothetical protein BGW41_008345 [Actinomortierella wolfii]|nr:hypothetical protein BGW41_008345 [Actinomortierella wolfii]
MAEESTSTVASTANASLSSSSSPSTSASTSLATQIGTGASNVERGPFSAPVKCIKDEKNDLPFFQKSEAYARIMAYILALNTAVLNRKVSEKLHTSDNLQKILALLDKLDSWIALVPPKKDPQRFGNLAFRDYVRMLEEKAEAIQQEMLPLELHPALVEITPYLTQSMGHGTRIDYGSGHELAFVAWLCCLEMIGFLHHDDHSAIVLRVFVRYLDLVRKLQRTYQLEPAGSHGVWGLDDYQFLPYLWGSAQLRDHPRLKPIAIMQPQLVEDLAPDYLYFAAIRYIHQTKRGPFHEHSPVLFEISGVPGWPKVNTGMIKMYKAEVLNKFPVVQHLLFGTLLPWRPADNPDQLNTDDISAASSKGPTSAAAASVPSPQPSTAPGSVPTTRMPPPPAPGGPSSLPPLTRMPPSTNATPPRGTMPPPPITRRP